MKVEIVKFGPGLEVASGVDTVPMEHLAYLHLFNGQDLSTLVTGLNLYTDEKPWPWAGYQVLKVNGKVISFDRYDDISEVVKVLKAERPDVVHTHTRSRNLTEILRELRRQGVKIVHTVHGLDEVNDRRFDEVYELSDVITSPSAFSAQKVRDAKRDFARKVLACPNSTRFTDFRTDEDVNRTAYLIRNKVAPNGERVIAITGRLEEDKGVFEAAEAVADLVVEGYNLKFLHAGMVFNSENEDRLRGIFRRRGIEDRLCLYGKIEAAQDPKHMAALYKVADIFVIPSDLKNETFCVSALEALAMEVPTVVSNVGGMSEVYVRPGLAIGIPPRDTSAVKDAIKYVLANYVEEKDRARRASDVIDGKYHSRVVTANLCDLYRKLLDGENITQPFFGDISGRFFGEFS